MSGSRPRRRTRATRLAMLAVAVMVSCLLASVPASAAGTGSIAGVVTGPGGVPLQGVTVDIYPQFQTNEIVWGGGTDATGAYEIPNLAAGNYKLLFGYANVNSPYVQEFYDSAFDATSADLVSVPDGAAVTGVDAELAVGASISGRFTTPAGVGAHGGVLAHRLAVDGRYPPFYGSAETSSDGFYTVQGLPAGTYRLSFYDVASGLGEFWNDKTSIDAADIIVLTVGQVRTGVDAVVGISTPPLPAIANTQLPQVSGATAPQVGYPMSLSTGTWAPGNVAVIAQWLAGGQPIPGAFYGEYKPTLADLGKTLAVTVTASLPGYVSATATTLPTLPVSKQVQNNVRPWLKGAPRVGERLKVKAGAWRPLNAVTFRYRWYADGHRIRGARSDHLRLAPVLKGSKVFCRVTGSAPGLDVLKMRTRSSPRITR